MLITANEAKRAVADALAAEGMEYTKLQAKRVGFDGEYRYFVKPVGLALPDARCAAVKESLKGTGALLDVPSIVAPGYVVE